MPKLDNNKFVVLESVPEFATKTKVVFKQSAASVFDGEDDDDGGKVYGGVIPTAYLDTDLLSDIFGAVPDSLVITIQAATDADGMTDADILGITKDKYK